MRRESTFGLYATGAGATRGWFLRVGRQLGNFLLATDNWPLTTFMRTISGVILGYLIFAVPVYLLFRATHQDPHAPTIMGFEIAAIVYGIFFAFLAGYWATAIGCRSDMLVASVVGLIMAAIAIASMVAKGVSWSPLSALIVMVPAELVGGYVRARKERRA